MTSKERLRAAVEHRQPDRLPVDFGGSSITGIHCSVVENLRRHYRLEPRPVKVCEPYQMLGAIEDDLREAMGVDTAPIFPHGTLFGFPNDRWKEWRTPWGQNVLVSAHFEVDEREDGVYIYPQGDRGAAPSAHLPKTGYFFDAIVRQGALDEDNLNLEDNLEEFGPMSAAEEAYWREQAPRLRGSGRAVVTHLGGTALGDIALVPAPFLKAPKGVRGIAEWYMTVASNPAFVSALFDRQVEIALGNLARLNAIAGDVIDIAVVCGTDFGTQESTFCSRATFNEVWKPRYRRINDWIHANTPWKTFKHTCGAIESLLPDLVEAGFDIVNPVQCSAKGMDPRLLKERHGDRVTFWGGGVNTQKTLPFGTPQEVRREVLERCEIFAPGGGFVFNAIHNVQALTPTENVVAMIEAVREFNGATA
ncbi:MAG: uroporphyrinogen decarboxylase family protein [Chthoniobacteraceae bacterium]|nr:uroporphyrinogen decarboxylase family protein [Chthoniobacteraceae bacterium]